MLSRFDFACLARNHKPPDCPAEHDTPSRPRKARAAGLSEGDDLPRPGIAKGKNHAELSGREFSSCFFAEVRAWP
jgi:hypothetical protein